MPDLQQVFLKEIEIPEYCYLSEAVEWVALGRVPEADLIEHRKTYHRVEARFYWTEMPEDFEDQRNLPWFDRAECESLGITIPENYDEIVERCYMNQVDHIEEEIAKFRFWSKDSNIEGSEVGWSSLIDQSLATLRELQPYRNTIDQINTEGARFFDLAWAKLFQLIFESKLGVEAINFQEWDKFAYEESTREEFEKAAVYKPVHSKYFNVGFAWTKNEVLTPEGRLVALRVPTAAILENQDFLLNRGKELKVERFGMHYHSSDISVNQKRSSVGRPFSMDWGVLSEHLGRLVAEGKKPPSKESCIYELIFIAQREFGKNISRTSVQRNLGKMLNSIYAQK